MNGTELILTIVCLGQLIMNYFWFEEKQKGVVRDNRLERLEEELGYRSKQSGAW